MSDHHKKLKNTLRELEISFFTGLAKIMVIQPFDLMRYRIQTSKKTGIRNIYDSLIRHEGISALFKGSSVTAIGSLSSSLIHFTLYQHLLSIFSMKYNINQFIDFSDSRTFETINKEKVYSNLELTNKLNREKAIKKQKEIKNNQISKIKEFISITSLSAFLSGLGLGITTIPMDNVRIRLQSTSNLLFSPSDQLYKYKTPKDCIKDVYKKQGIRGFFAGVKPAMLRESLASLIYFTSFESLKNFDKFLSNLNQIPIYRTFIYGGIAGGLNWLITLPIDKIKTKVISSTLANGQKEGVLSIVRRIIKNDGFIGFYKGFSVVLLRGIIVNGITLTSFEYFRNKL